MSQIKSYSIALILGLGILAASCGSEEWSSVDQNKLLDRCIAEGGTKSYCKCYLSNAMKAYPDADDMDDLDFESSVELSIDCK